MDKLGTTGPPSVHSYHDEGVNHTLNHTLDLTPHIRHSMWQVVLMIIFCGILTVVTIIGNLLVLVSFKLEKQLKTITNYFLMSLAVSDMLVGVFSMPLYTLYLVLGHEGQGVWVLGPLACDLWLAMDYTMSNASALNLCVISLDRYLSITRPLSYRSKRTRKRVVKMIACVWIVSFFLWTPAIVLWPLIEGREVPHDQCYIQFLSTPSITFGTAIAAFYVPVSIMTILYFRIWRETRLRRKELVSLQESQHGTTLSGTKVKKGVSEGDGGGKRNTTRKKIAVHLRCFRRGSSNREQEFELDSDYISPIHSSSGEVGGAARDRPSVTALSTIVMKWNPEKQNKNVVSTVGARLSDGRYSSLNSGHGKDSGSRDSDLEVDNINCTTYHAVRKQPSLQYTDSPNHRPSDSPNHRLTDSPNHKAHLNSSGKKLKRKGPVTDKKAAKTLSAILLAFVVTWTPYNVCVIAALWTTIPNQLYAFGYWFCYINSTVNPFCYALCNNHFRNTFKQILMCRWKKGRHRSRGVLTGLGLGMSTHL